MRVLRAALQIDAGAQRGIGGDAVVALDPDAALVVEQAAVGDLTEEAQRVGGAVAGGEDNDIGVQRCLLAGDE